LLTASPVEKDKGYLLEMPLIVESGLRPDLRTDIRQDTFNV